MKYTSTTPLGLPTFDTDVLEENAHSHQLIVWNDDVNTFEWVIETLMTVCLHDEIQAEQCTLLIHHKGKCSVKNGDYHTLKPMCDAITDREINATIEELVT